MTGKAKASGSADAASHAADALIACQKFAVCLPNPAEKCGPEPRARSLIGGAILWAGWSADLDLLHMPCMVIRPDGRERVKGGCGSCTQTACDSLMVIEVAERTPTKT